MVSGNAPDLLTGNDETSYKWAEKKQLLDLNPLVERDLTAEQIADFFEYQWNGLIYPGDQTRMGIPYYTWVYQYYYNIDAFDEAGLDYPKAGWTLDDYSADLEKLVKQGLATRSPAGAAWTAPTTPSASPSGRTSSAATSSTPRTGPSASVSSDETKAAFEWHRERLWDTNTLIQTDSRSASYANLDLLATEKVAIQGEGNGAEGILFSNPPSIKWACVAPPVGPTGKAEGIGTVDNWGIWSGTKAPDVVWDLLKIVALEDDFQEGFSALWVATPNRKSRPAQVQGSREGEVPRRHGRADRPAARAAEQRLRQDRRAVQEAQGVHRELLLPVMEKHPAGGRLGSRGLLDAVCEEITALNREA